MESRKLTHSLYAHADNAYPQPVREDSVNIVESEVKKLSFLAEAVKQLSELRSYEEEARELSSRGEAYASIIDLAVRG